MNNVELELNNILISKRIEILISRFKSKYPESYVTNIIHILFNELHFKNFLVNLSIEIWKITPSNILTLDEIIDSFILAQLSYNINTVFLNLPDLCDYGTNLNQYFELSHIQLGIIWITAFIMDETTELTLKWKDKKLSDENKKLIEELIVKYQRRIINTNNMISLSDTNKDVKERRQIIGKYVYQMENELYREILMFFNTLCITKLVNTPTYQKQILDKLNMIPYYFHINPTMNGNKKRKNKKYNQYTNSNKLMMKELMLNYVDIYNKYNERTNIGVRFL
jgi:hypothetical protein